MNEKLNRWSCGDADRREPMPVVDVWYSTADAAALRIVVRDEALLQEGVVAGNRS